MEAKLDHFFLIPSDGSHDASLSLPVEKEAGMWRGGIGDENDLVSLIASLGVSRGPWSVKPQQANSPALERHKVGGVNTIREFPGSSLVAAAMRGCGEAASKGKRGVMAALKERRLPDVQNLLMSRTPTSSPSEVQMETLSPLHSSVSPDVANTSPIPKFSTLQTATMKRFQLDPVGGHRMKTTGRARTPDKLYSSRGGILNDGSLTLQTALVTMLHFQKQGRDTQRKPVIPKRNLMCMSFLRMGVCTNRDVCNYAHDMMELQKKLELRKTSLCKYWLKGKCENEDCNFAHGEHELQSTVGVFKTTICKYWRQGCCYSGQYCRHAHGEADLRPVNLPPHLERKKMQQQYRFGMKGFVGGRRRVRSADEAGEIDDEDDSLGLMLTPLSCYDQIRQVLCESGVFGEAVPSSVLETMMDESDKMRRHRESCTNSDMSTEIFGSPEPGSPRAIMSAGSTTTPSLWSAPSPEQGFTSGVPSSNGFLLPPLSPNGENAQTDGKLFSRSPATGYGGANGQANGSGLGVNTLRGSGGEEKRGSSVGGD